MFTGHIVCLFVRKDFLLPFVRCRKMDAGV